MTAGQRFFPAGLMGGLAPPAVAGYCMVERQGVRRSAQRRRTATTRRHRDQRPSAFPAAAGGSPGNPCHPIQRSKTMLRVFDSRLTKGAATDALQASLHGVGVDACRGFWPAMVRATDDRAQRGRTPSWRKRASAISMPGVLKKRETSFSGHTRLRKCPRWQFGRHGH